MYKLQKSHGPRYAKLKKKKGMIILSEIFEYLFCLPFFQLYHCTGKKYFNTFLNLQKKKLYKEITSAIEEEKNSLRKI